MLWFEDARGESWCAFRTRHYDLSPGSSEPSLRPSTLPPPEGRFFFFQTRLATRSARPSPKRRRERSSRATQYRSFQRVYVWCVSLYRSKHSRSKRLVPDDDRPNQRTCSFSERRWSAHQYGAASFGSHATATRRRTVRRQREFRFASTQNQRARHRVPGRVFEVTKW